MKLENNAFAPRNAMEYRRLHPPPLRHHLSPETLYTFTSNKNSSVPPCTEFFSLFFHRLLRQARFVGLWFTCRWFLRHFLTSVMASVSWQRKLPMFLSAGRSPRHPSWGGFTCGNSQLAIQAWRAAGTNSSLGLILGALHAERFLSVSVLYCLLAVIQLIKWC